MKKFLVKVLTVVLSLVMITGCLASCGLFEVNTDRDMAQIVANVNIDGLGDLSDAQKKDPKNDPVYKRELISAFTSYGYMYVQSYGYTASQTYNLIMDNIINNKVILQNAKNTLKANYKVADANAIIDAIEGYSKYALALFASQAEVEAFNAENPSLTIGASDYLEKLSKKVHDTYYDKEVTRYDPAFRFIKLEDIDLIWKALSDTKDSVNSLIASFLDEEETHEHEHITYTVRATPDMGEKDEEEEIDVEKCKANLIKLSGNERVNALVDARNRFEDIGLVYSNENYSTKFENERDRDISILNISYFRSAITATLENEVISYYEDHLREEKKLTANDGDALWAAYLDLQNAQNEEFNGNVSSLETSLGAVSDSTFVAYNKLSGYAYISHILVQYDEDTKAALDEAIAGNVTNDVVKTKVEDAVKNVKAQDLRATWVQSGYGVYDNGEVKFTSDYVYTDALAKFDGTIERMTAHTEEEDDGRETLHINYYGVKGNEIDFTEFSALASRVITGDQNASALVLGEVRKVADYATSKQDVKNRFEDLKFAYSTDEGNFNNYLGYLYSPVTSATQYVSAFAEACAKVIDVDAGYGAGSYVMFGSYEYGLHIVLCTEIAADYLLYDNADDFKADLDDEGTVAYNFLKATNDLLESNYISKLANKFVQDGLKDGCVSKYESTYANLVDEEA
ncbi:MAG: hypothetical protein IJY84_05555 [Clostridia bacterium]|nr:hypothetical protein [Clostridia bacterium]